MTQHFSLMIHGGSGTLEQIQREGNRDVFMASLDRILAAGRQVLAAGGSALDAVETCVRQLEDDPLYNAGRGAVLNEQGRVEMDAAIMDGKTLAAGAIAGVSRIKNPVTLARCVLAQNEHVLLMGQGAQAFAERHGLEQQADEYFILPSRLQQWREAHEAGERILDHENTPPQSKFGTVGAVARDYEGNLAAATSTGGIVNKRWGRVGDSPIVGAGVYADNMTCAVSATGYGEQFQRTVLSKLIADFIYFKELDAQAAAIAGIQYLVERVQGLGGVIVLDRRGRCGVAHSTSGMIYGVIEQSGESHCHLS